MSQSRQSREKIHATISGSVSGQVAVGSGITQVQSTVSGLSAEVTEAEMGELRLALANLKKQVEEQAPPAEREAALERLSELEEAATAKEPDLTTLEYVKGWFVKHLPGLASSVGSIVVHPIVAKLVGAAGETLAAEFRRRFGG